MLFYSDIIWIALLAAAVGAALAFLLTHKKSPEKKVAGKTAIVEGIRDNALSFSEMFEPVYSVSAGKIAKQEEVFAAWNSVAANCGDEDFAAAFNAKFGDYASWGVSKKGKVNTKKLNKAYAKNARSLVKFFFRAGIIREPEINVVADETTAEKYNIVSGSIESGATYDVLAPYWHLSSDVVDKGVIR